MDGLGAYVTTDVDTLEEPHNCIAYSKAPDGISAANNDHSKVVKLT